MDVLGRFSDFKKITQENNFSREKAVEKYLADGGVLKFEGHKLIYPDRARIQRQLDSVSKKRDYLNGLIKELEKRQSAHEYDSTFKVFGRVFDPLYWEHMYKMHSNDEYKNSFEKVQPPIERMKDVRWRGVVKMFVQSEDYRERLVEAKTGIIGKNSGTIRDSVEKTLDSNRKMMQSRLDKLKKEKKIFDERVKVLKALKTWAE